MMESFRVMIREVVTEQRATFDENHARGYIDKFIIEQKNNRGKYFTDEDLVINCQVRS